MIRLFLATYAVTAIGLWWFCAMVPDGPLHTSYSYACLAFHVLMPIWIAQRSAKYTARSILDYAEQDSPEIRITGVASQHR